MTHTQTAWPWHPTVRGLFVSISSAAIGISFWIIERDWYVGALAAISLWIIFGLLAQVHDSGGVPREVSS